MKAWRYVSVLAFIVVVLSAINIGFVGIAKYDIIGHLARGTFGDVTTGSRIVFTVIGIAGLIMIPWLVSTASGRMRARERYETSYAWLMTGWVALLVATLGALNWGFIGIAKYDVVGALAGLKFGALAAGNRIPFTVVGLAGLVLIPFLVSLLSGQLSLLRPEEVVERERLEVVTEEHVVSEGEVSEEEHRRAA
jgi:uncharacterized membrane protein YuzA (DUF378 family)